MGGELQLFRSAHKRRECVYAMHPPHEPWALVRIDRYDIFFLRYTLEAYEGLCVTTTMPGGEGLVRLQTTSDLLGELTVVLDALAKEVELEIIEWGRDES